MTGGTALRVLIAPDCFGDTLTAVLAGQVTLDKPTLAAAGIGAAFAVADYAGSVQRAIGDAANQLTGLARRTPAELPAGGT